MFYRGHLGHLAENKIEQEVYMTRKAECLPAEEVSGFRVIVYRPVIAAALPATAQQKVKKKNSNLS